MRFQKLKIALVCTACILGCMVLAARKADPVKAAEIEETVETTKDAQEDGTAAAWPDIHEVQAQVKTESEPEDVSEETLTETVAPRSTPYTEEEIAEIFGALPFYFDCGSFALNKLNNIPLAVPFWNDPAFVEIDGQLYLRGSWSALEEKLTAMLEGYLGDWSVYIKDLSADRTIEINEHAMQSASLIKLYIAGAAYEQIELGNLAETETITNALYNMITVSDNESANVLVRAMCDETGDFQTGLAVVNDFISRYGFSNTEQVNGISDPSLWVSDGRINMTSTADCGKLLEYVYSRKLVSHFSSFRLEVLLNKQEVNYKIPAGLPEDVHISHKTGEDSDTENDAAIIYTPHGDYIFCIMSTDQPDTNAAVEHIREITALVYEYFTEDLTPVGLLGTGDRNTVSAGTDTAAKSGTDS